MTASKSSSAKLSRASSAERIQQGKQTPKSGPEIFVGLVGAVGTDLRAVVELLREEFGAVGYNLDEVRLSRLLSQCHKYRKLRGLARGAEDTRIDKHMDAGDDLRRTMNRGDGVALLAVGAIREIRADAHGNPDEALPARVYILNSLKHPSEIETLRTIYGDAFFSLSIYSPKHERTQRLAQRIASSRHSSDLDRYVDVAVRLVNKDAKRVGEDLGQNVQDTFPKADLFIRMSQRENMRSQLRRFVRLLFNYPYHTPSKDEYGMFHARAASLRSADLSRQVGAAITSDEGDLISVGCNEVPKAKGGSVWEGDEQDYRDFRLGYDSSARMKHEIIGEILNELKNEGWLSEEKSREDIEELVEQSLYAGENPPLKGARVANIIEFGRIVHAEMSALSHAARQGISVRGAILYCTTFPCHMCARHLIASGIVRVVYIEPYPKSMAKDLYQRSIQIEGDEADDDAVEFVPFVGVSPRKYFELFEMTNRKNAKGEAVNWKASEAAPRLSQAFPRHLQVEAGYIDYLREHEIEFGLVAGKK